MGIASGIFLGIVYAASPGPLTVETLRRGTQGGFLDSLAVQTGSSVGRILYPLLALSGAGLLLQGATLRLATGVIGMTVLIYLGITAIRNGRFLIVRNGERTVGEGRTRRAFWAGAILSLASPMAIVFWLSIGNSVLNDSGLEGPAFLSGFFLGCIVTSLVVALFAGFWQSRLTSRLVLAISWTCGLAMIAFGLRLGLSVGRVLMIW